MLPQHVPDPGALLGGGRAEAHQQLALALDRRARDRPAHSQPLEQQLQRYAALTVKVGLNLQRGQRLFIIGPLANGGVALEAAALVRHIAEAAYDAGAELVEPIWGDEAIQAVRFAHAPRDSFDAYSAWLPQALVQHVEAGHAVLSIYANDPDQLKQMPPDLEAEREDAEEDDAASAG